MASGRALPPLGGGLLATEPVSAQPLPNSSSFTSWAAPFALMVGSVTLYWDYGAVFEGIRHYMLIMAHIAFDLVSENPAEAMLAALITAWALSSAELLGRSTGNRLRRLQHRSAGVYNLARKLLQQRQIDSSSKRRKPLSGLKALHVSKKDSCKVRPGISFQLSPGPRIVLQWVSECPGEGKRTPTQFEPGTPASKPLTGHALDLPEEVAHTSSRYSADWGVLNFSSYMYWPDLGWSSRTSYALETTAEADSYDEFSKTLETDLRRNAPHSALHHSISMPAIPQSSVQSGPFSFDTDLQPEGPAPSPPEGGPGGAGAIESLKEAANVVMDKQMIDAIPDHFFLQFAALLGERPAAAALHKAGLPNGCQHSEALYGQADSESVDAPWEEFVVETLPGKVHYRAERRQLRRGINMYRSVTIFEDSSAKELRRFTVDDHNRLKWDDNALEHVQLLPNGLGAHQQETCFLYTRSKFPRPMAAREYIYARRVIGSSDGGCYLVQVTPKTGEHPPVPMHNGRGVNVTDFASSARIRSVPSPSGRKEPAAELSLIYFEDSQVRPGLMNMAVAKGVWTFVQRQEAVFRCYQASMRRRSLSIERTLPCGPSAEPPSGCQGHYRAEVGESFHHAPPTSEESLSELEFSAVVPRPGSRRARWKRRLLVGAVIVRHVLAVLND